MALRSSSLMLWLWAACTLSLWLGFCLRAGGRTVSRNVERIRRGSVEHSATRIARVICTSFKSRRLTMKESMRCQCLDMGCIQEVLCMSLSWKKAFMMARPNSQQREQSEIAAIQVANTMMTYDSMPYLVIFVYHGIEIAQHYDFVIL